MPRLPRRTSKSRICRRPLAEHSRAILSRCSDSLASPSTNRLLIGVTRLALSPDKSVRGHFHGASACLSALFAAGRYAELIELVRGDTFWPYKLRIPLIVISLSTPS